MQIFKSLLIISLIGLVGSFAFIFSGLYPIGADNPHTKVVYWVLETLRARSVANASKDIVVPELDDPGLLLSGGPDYNEMCAGCHLKPGKTESDLSLGLYPAPLNLTIRREGYSIGDDRSEQKFWVIKHGIKASAMPAWGLTHDDGRIWAMVAFLQKLPELTPFQYQILTARTSSNEERQTLGHDHRKTK